MSLSSSSSTDHHLRSEKLYLVESSISEILGSKLPSKRQVLQYFLEALKTEKQLLPAAKATFNAIKPFYVRAGLQTLNDDYGYQKIKKFYESYKALHKSSRNKSEMNTPLFKGRENKFMDELDDLFDIASTDLSKASAESKEFLAQQRMKGRPGTITFARIPKQPKTPSTTTLESLDEVFQSESLLGASGVTAESSASVLSTSSSMSLMSLSDRNDPDFDISQYEKQIPIPPVILTKNFLTER